LSHSQYVAFVVTGLGFVVTILFYIGVPEPTFQLQRQNLPRETDEEDVDTNYDEPYDAAPLMTWRDWFSVADFYLVALLYMSTRLFGNLTQTYLPLYVLETQHFEKVLP